MSKTLSLSIFIAFLSIFLTTSTSLHAETDTFLHNISYGTDMSYVEVPFLIVNTHASLRTIVKKSETAGQEDIYELVKYATLEEKWVYLPGRQLWIEMGFHAKKIEESDRLGFQVFSSMKEINKIFLTEKKLVDYHFHPANYLFMDSNVQTFLKEASIENNDKNFRAIEANYFLPVQHICSAMPGRDDLLQLLVSSSLFYRIHPDGDFCHKVVSSYGITTYAVKEEKKDVIGNFTLEEAEAVANKLTAYIDQYIGCKLTLKHNNVKDKETGIKIIRQTIRRLNYLDLVQLDFTLHKENQ